MSEQSPTSDDALPLAAKQRIDRLCIAFEDAWKMGERPGAEQYLEQAPPSERPLLLLELLPLEAYYRCQRDEAFAPEEFRSRFADYPHVVADVLKAITTCPACSTATPSGASRCPHCGATIPDRDAPPAHSSAADSGSSLAESGRPVPPSHRAPSLEPSVHGQFLPGAVLVNRYRIVALLGRGGMGEVYRADDLKLGQATALKFLPKDFIGDAAAETFFHNEVRLARRIAHPNVCRTYDIGEVDGQPFLSMEYVDGEDLDSLLRRIGRLPADRGLAVARQLAAGLAAAHEQGILHHDLKPANAMLDGRGQVRVTDFGLACLSDAAVDEHIRAGTPAYMAPEQLAGEPATVRSDLYSLGLVLYEVFTGRQPFPADLHNSRKGERLRTSPTPPSHLVEGLEPGVEQVVLQLLAPDPQDRPSSALAVLAALPGDDPLQAALNAGDTPSPEMVAAARLSGGLSAGARGLCFATMIVVLLAVVALSDRTSVVGQAQPKNPDALAERARRILPDHECEQPPADWSCGFQYEKNPARVTPMSFRYRQSSTDLIPRLFAGSIVAKGDGTVRLDDPPPPIPGEAAVRLDPQGNLLELRISPLLDDEDDSDPGDEAVFAPDFPPWRLVLFRAAGLIGEKELEIDPGEFPSVSAARPSPVPCDRRHAWEGVQPDTGIPLRVEAAVLDGRPVYFRIEARRDRKQQSSSALTSTAASSVRIALFIAMITSAGLLARHNLRRGRGDRKGAFRLACFIFVVRLLSWSLLTGRAANPPPWSVFAMGLQIALFWSIVVWLFYVALEPYARRLWPETLVSWNRLTAGRFRDPLVGRDILIGAVFGAATKLLWQIGVLAPLWFGFELTNLLGPQRVLLGIGLRPLSGGRYCLGELIHFLATAVIAGLIALLFLLLLRLVLRRKTLAGAAYVLYGAVMYSVGVGHPSVSWFFAACGSALIVVAALRFGLLAVVSWAYVCLLLSFPITADLSAWRAAGSTLLPLAVVIALAAYGLYASLTGRRFAGQTAK